ncbi:MAG TPA: hypothetical protein VMK30_00985 [Pleomorphomonadaceae bacterium]|nr:hypothetical protein [Pleomorphomonadaceae bacterium]
MRPRVAPRVSNRWIRPLAAAAALMLLATACASGGGGGGGGGTYVLRVLLVNRDPAASHVLSYSGGAPLASSPDEETVESCSAAIVHYDLVDPFELLVDGVPVIISDELLAGVPQETDVIATMDVLEDGTAIPFIGDSSRGSAVVGGRGLSKPAAVAICL